MRWSCAAVPMSISTASTVLCALLPRTGILCACPGADRNLLRIAVYEMRFLTDEEVSDAIVINEAVELAKAYGTDQSASFVNGVLGKIARSEELPGEDLYQELLAEDRAREEAQAAEAPLRIAVAQAEAGVLAEDADAAEAVEPTPSRSSHARGFRPQL